ncbi:MAG: type I glyceraldehyde-3-phosphate dehydrogenase [Bacteroidales bacterium]|nr:type I glyceraldehyde-3-phosphate dehydrogenase [Bacteroidales bacterium]MBS3776121.1 type I glyceraldehyde-3-phosphate dehydrogenase [Bacteroidales bacterium]
MKKVAINGLGRIGRATLKIIMERSDMELVAVNDIAPIANMVYLLKYDTVYGRYEKEVCRSKDAKSIAIEDYGFYYYSEKDPSQLPWKSHDIDVVFECTGLFTKTEELQKHLDAGAKQVILSAPTKSEEMQTVVHGVNKNEGNKQIISCASCTTNCITPVVEVMKRRIGIEKATMSTIHAYTSTQSLVDTPATKFKRGRAGAANMVPTTTGAATASAKALPDIKGKFNGVAVRVPIPAGSLADIVFVTSKPTDRKELNDIFREEARSKRYKDILGVTEDGIVSADIVKDPRASVVDLTMTQVVDGDLVKIMSWYDNEWGYASQMVKEAAQE